MFTVVTLHSAGNSSFHYFDNETDALAHYFAQTNVRTTSTVTLDGPLGYHRSFALVTLTR